MHACIQHPTMTIGIAPVLTILLIVVHYIVLVQCYSSSFGLCRPAAFRPTQLGSGSTIDYEYIPNDKSDSNWTTDLPSAYNVKDTPASLRGEAVRSALRSGQCLAMQFQDTPLESALMRLQGKGCLPFLHSKLTAAFNNSQDNTVKRASLLNAKGGIVDTVSVAVVDSTLAYLVTSPGHKGSDIFTRLDPFIFPMDQVKLTNCLESNESNSYMFTLVSTKKSHVQAVLTDQMQPLLSSMSSSTKLQLPEPNKCTVIAGSNNDSSLVIYNDLNLLPSFAAQCYTFLFINCRNDGQAVYRHLVSQQNARGPVEIGPLEYETLRIEYGMPGYQREMTASLVSRNNKTLGAKLPTPASPLELHLDGTIDTDKGCYLGQEGVASVVKNPRGSPRLLYQVVFDDDFNLYDYQSSTDEEEENNTRIPRVGDQLYVLGSNEEILVGAITSVAEPGGTGDSTTYGLCLVRRADSILKKMQVMSIETQNIVPMSNEDGNAKPANTASGMVLPPPLDPLDGLEVIIGGCYTIGRLKMVPYRQYENKKSSEIREDDTPQFVRDMDDPNQILVTRSQYDFAEVFAAGNADAVQSDATIESDNDTVEKAKEDAKMNEETKAKEQAAEAERKAEKMRLLQERAAQALAKRKQMKK